MRRTVRTTAGAVSFDNDTLQAVMADFKKNGKARVHVGILGGFDQRAPEGEEGSAPVGNAELGVIHEFGVISEKRNIPARSFLRMPVINELPGALAVTRRDLWHRVIVQKGVRGALGLLGAYALDVIHLAFETGGFGHWQALSPRTVRAKMKKGRGAGSTSILIDSAQMRQAITAELVDPKQ